MLLYGKRQALKTQATKSYVGVGSSPARAPVGKFPLVLDFGNTRKPWHGPTNRLCHFCMKAFAIILKNSVRIGGRVSAGSLTKLVCEDKFSPF